MACRVSCSIECLLHTTDLTNQTRSGVEYSAPEEALTEAEILSVVHTEWDARAAISEASQQQASNGEQSEPKDEAIHVQIKKALVKSIPRHAVLKPSQAVYRLQNQTFALGDRVVSVLDTGGVPQGFKGFVGDIPLLPAPLNVWSCLKQPLIRNLIKPCHNFPSRHHHYLPPRCSSP